MDKPHQFRIGQRVPYRYYDAVRKDTRTVNATIMAISGHPDQACYFLELERSVPTQGAYTFSAVETLRWAWATEYECLAYLR